MRAARDEELEELWDVVDLAFHATANPELRARRRAWTARPAYLVAEQDGAVVGTTASWSWTVSVPGGTLPIAAVTVVTVLPTHRRRGILRAMMEQVAVDARRRGEPLAGLWASQGTIYGRFGYGPASASRSSRAVLRGGVPLRVPVPEPLDVRFVPASEAHPVVGPIFERARSRRGGLLSRPEEWWTLRLLADPVDEQDGAGPLRVVVAGDDGYALYRVRESEATSPVSARTTVEVSELVGTAAAERVLLTFLARIDLADELVLAGRPLDDPLTAATVDARAIVPGDQHDALWLRILDLPAAVAGRAWATDVDLVLRVDHPEDPLIDGTWALRAGRDGATCVRTEASPDLRLHARDLASLYLGGTTAVALRDAGVVDESTGGSASALDAALRVDRLPWTSGTF